jgi:hypothetical protein
MNGKSARRARIAQKNSIRSSTLGIAVFVLGSAVTMGPAAEGKTLHGRLTFNDSQLTNCYYRNQFFGINLQARFGLFDSAGTVQVDPPPGQPLYTIGRFARYGATPSDPGGISSGHTGPGSVNVTCNATPYNIPVDDADLPHINLVMNRPPPTSNGIVATFNGQVVRGVPPGSTVTLTIAAANASGGISWAANEGKIKKPSGKKVQWKLPVSRGIHFAYALINDGGIGGSGGYREDSIAISTDGNVVPAVPKVRAASTASDFIRVTDHFLTYYSTEFNYAIGADSKVGSCLYYKAIGVVSDCASDGAMIGQLIDFDTWRAKWGFGNGVSAVYANIADLNLQRDMHGVTTSGGTAFYVCNSPNSADFPNLIGAIKHDGVVACVAMEYSPPAGGGNPFTKFITFGPNGKLLQSVNLDGRGEKYLPGACVICHGSANDIHFKGRIDENAPVDPDLQAHFLAFDLDNFAFSTKARYNRSVEEPLLQQLNNLVLNTSPPPATSELINGWYAGGSFNGTFVPPGWSGNPDFYRGVIKPACRMCHVANNFPFNTENQVKAFAPQIAGRVCGSPVFALEKDRYAMPNAKTTFDRFWNDEGGIGGDPQAKRMLDFLNANLPAPGLAKCIPPSY